VTKPLEFDFIVLVCKGCAKERRIYPDRVLRGAAELIEWMKTKPTPCECGALTCDVKAHMKGDPCLSCGELKADSPGDDCQAKDFHEVKA
jgi:hypothetical protein